MKSEPLTLLTWILPWIIVFALAVVGKYVLGRPLVWTEVLALVGVVQGAGMGYARTQVLSQNTAESVVADALRRAPPPPTDAPAMAKAMVKEAKSE